jgi:hypothetical protein
MGLPGIGPRINITAAPPTSEWIRSQRDGLSLHVAERELRAKRINWLLLAIAATSAVATFWVVPPDVVVLLGPFYLAVILANALISQCFGDVRISAGIATGAVCGLLGALLLFKFGFPAGFLSLILAIFAGPFISEVLDALLFDPCLTIDLQKRVDGFEAINGSDAPAILEAVNSDALVGKYAAAVVEQRRELMRAEAQAIKAWMEGAGERSIAAAEQDALRALRQPVVEA